MYARLSLFAAAFAVANGQGISRFFQESFQPQIDASPLHVELQTSEFPGKIQAIISNRAEKTAYFSTSGNPLASQAEAGIRVYDQDEQLISIASPEAHVIGTDDFQMIPAGKSIVRDISLNDYEVKAGERYFAQSAGYVPYYLEGQMPDAAASQTAMFEANVLSFIASGTGNIPINNKAVQAPAANQVLFKGCKDKTLELALNKTFDIALTMTTKTIEYIKTGKDREAFKTWFKNDDPETHKAVLARYEPIAKALATKTGPITIECAESDWGVNYCKVRQALAYTDPPIGKASFCPDSKFYPVECKRCNDGNQAGNLIHELTHMSPIYKPPTVDHCQGSTPCKALSAAKMIMNANNYNMLAQSIYLGKPC
ncbi:zincin [Microthyrium microscopicum]|uniref:Zincin n=1 Tax=Microthyrium microscopicum TaxID=703497 RepID=A0A6A6UDK8_9PEZI|nr:zincin [Microthyrium microscopicum]